MSDPGGNDPSALNREQQDGQSAIPDQPMMMSPGVQLAAYRKERGWTIEQVASQLNLAPRQIVAIESDDYPALPGMPIIRGFIRAYAKLLKVDPVPLIAMLGGETVFINELATQRRTLSTPFSEKRMPPMMERPGLSSKWIIGLLLAILLGVAIWAAQQGRQVSVISKPASSSEAIGPASTSSPDVAQQKAVDQGAGRTELNAAPAQAAGADVAPEPAPTATVSNAVPAPAVQAKAAPEAMPPSDSPARTGKDMLLLNVRQDSWIEIRRAGSNTVAVSRIVKAGETEAFEVTEPIAIVIGNAAGVEASLRGTSLPLKTGSGNVARLNLK